MKVVPAAAVALLVGLCALSGPLESSATAATLADECKVARGGELTETPWAQTRLDFQRAWSVTKGKFVKTGHAGSVGQRVRVAVIDSGLDAHPQFKGLDAAAGINSVSSHQTANVADCNGHGTGVTSIIAAQPDPTVPFVGIAPDVQILTIKQTQQKDGSTAATIRAIDDAIAEHAQVANLSLSIAEDQPALLAAVQRAAKAGLILVAAAGNDGQNTNRPAYPAAYSPKFSNVIAVSASDASDSLGTFSSTGNYVSVAAPGADVVVAAPNGGYGKQSGTSFAAPFVTGTVALVLAADPDLTPAEVRNRIEATADAPPASVPDPQYGYGIVNPYLAVTTVRDDTVSVPATRSGPAFPAPAAPHSPDRHLQHLALAAAVVLIGLAVLAMVGAAVLRGRKPTGEQTVVG